MKCRNFVEQFAGRFNKPQNLKLAKFSIFEIHVQISICLLIFDKPQQRRTQNFKLNGVKSKNSCILFISAIN